MTMIFLRCELFWDRLPSAAMVDDKYKNNIDCSSWVEILQMYISQFVKTKSQIMAGNYHKISHICNWIISLMISITDQL